MVNNHGDRKSPKDRVVGPVSNGLSMACFFQLGFCITKTTIPAMQSEKPPGIFDVFGFVELVILFHGFLPMVDSNHPVLSPRFRCSPTHRMGNGDGALGLQGRKGMVESMVFLKAGW